MRALVPGALLLTVAACSGSAVQGTTTPAKIASCSAAGLRAAFTGVQFGTGNDFGSIVVWNSGPECELVGHVTFAAYSSSGASDPLATTVTKDVTVATVLGARMTPYHDGASLVGYVAFPVMGSERDDPRQPDGLCRKADELTPGTLVLGVGALSLRVANLDGGRGGASARSVYGCHGKILLEKPGVGA